jgi:hypothetical protein
MGLLETHICPLLRVFLAELQRPRLVQVIPCPVIVRGVIGSARKELWGWDVWWWVDISHFGQDQGVIGGVFYILSEF